MLSKSFLMVALSSLLMNVPAKATTADGLIIGGLAGLTAGFITNAVAGHTHHQRLCHRRPIYVEQPRLIEVHRPMVVEQVIEHRPVVVEQRIRPSKVVYQHAQAMPVQTTAQTATVSERELVLKEQQIKLDLLKEENKQRELKIRELELESKRISALKK